MFAFKIISVFLGIQFLVALDFDDLYEESDVEYYEDYYGRLISMESLR